MTTATRSRASQLLRARDPERVRLALHELDGGHRVAELRSLLTAALDGSDEAAREYVRGYRELASALLDEAHSRTPDLTVRLDDGSIALVDVNGHPTRAPVEALATAAAESPFGPCADSFELGDAVALDLTSRVRQLVGLRGLDAPARSGGVHVPVGDVAAQRFLRRVRHHLNHPDAEEPLQRVMDAFGLSKTQLGRLFGVRRQAIDSWLERGVPGERQEKLQTLVALADLLERKLKADRLPGVARRPADAYGGKTMLELIAADRHRELLEIVRDSFDWASAA
jgi:DNA-binding XRE family transcriptional regulator